MRITKNQLRRIIKEELAAVLREDEPKEETETKKELPADVQKAISRLPALDPDSPFASEEDPGLEDLEAAARAAETSSDAAAKKAKEDAKKKANESRRRKLRKTRRK